MQDCCLIFRLSNDDDLDLWCCLRTRTTTSPPNATTNSPAATTNSPAATTSMKSPVDVMMSSPAAKAEAAAGSVESVGPSSTLNDRVKLNANFITSPGSPPDELIDPLIDPTLLDNHINTQPLALSPDLGKENMPAAGTSVPAPSICPPPILLINPLAGLSRHPLTKTAMVNAAMTLAASVPLPGTFDAVKGALSSTIADAANPSFTSVSESTPLASSNDGPDTSLGKEQIKLYDTEAAHLEREGLWTKNGDIVDSAMY
ncbi:hypothetical protein EV702DRAFT_1198101 [Suillus placidus]|uniref:Uncharacterized protein n=1 Tax=Suillus placidus TaxID=48579 RepID=A0A9P6ZVS3_9AGAM|nr:hypothetical protein EV702DRAFT_1198101 [Suillus placidus]